jgi:LPS-assembly protein
LSGQRSNPAIYFGAVIAGLAFVSFSAHAQLTPGGGDKPVFSDREPVLFSAEEVHYDQERDLVTASGKVEVTQGETVLLADTMTYNQKTNQLRAEGNVSLLEPSGNVYFADALELRNDLKTGVIQQFKARLADDSRLVSTGARKIDEDRIELFKAAYTPCDCGTPENPKTPQWQVRADHVLVDQEAQKVVYDNATLEAYGIPVFYTPYLSHATPGADNSSGLLTPEYAHSKNLGAVVKVPVYYAIAPDKDATFIPIYTSEEGLVMSGEYRQMFDSGQLITDGSITRPQNRTTQGFPTYGHQTRGHINAQGRFRLAKDYDWGLDIHRTTDDTYLRRYNFSNETLLTSKVYAEGFNFVGDNDRTYGNIEGIAFQGLTARDEARRIPIALPLMNFTTQSDPGIYDSRFSFDANALSLYRELGPESRRLSAISAWRLPYISEGGQVIEFSTQLRSDVYAVNDVPLSNGEMYDGTTGRLVPQASMLWRYPFINQWESGSMIIEPTVSAVISPGGGNPEKIPNEDSLVPEFTDTNLFSTDRFAGLDRIENGPRVSYGLRGQMYLPPEKYIHWLIGQNYRTRNDPSFPYSNDRTSHFSDYVGKIGLSYHPFEIAYRFRLDRETLAAQRNEVNAGFNYDWLRVSLAYLALKNDPILADKEHISGSTGVQLSKNWTWTLGGSENLQISQPVSAYTGLVYRNECAQITSIVGREYTRDRDIKPSTNFLFRISLKNLE